MAHFTNKELDDRWITYCKALKEFKKKNGHTLVPQSFVDLESGLRLGRWVNYLRCAGEASLSSTEQRRDLHELGFVWQKRRKFEEMVQFMRDYKDEYGHCNVPKSYQTYGVMLGRWVINQRNEYSRKQRGLSHHISNQQIEILNHLGFEWVTDRRTKQLKAISQKQNKVPNMNNITATLVSSQHEKNANTTTIPTSQNIGLVHPAAAIITSRKSTKSAPRAQRQRDFAAAAARRCRDKKDMNQSDAKMLREAKVRHEALCLRRPQEESTGKNDSFENDCDLINHHHNHAWV